MMAASVPCQHGRLRPRCLLRRRPSLCRRSRHLHRHLHLHRHHLRPTPRQLQWPLPGLAEAGVADGVGGAAAAEAPE